MKIIDYAILNESKPLRHFQLPLIMVHFLTAIFWLRQDFFGILSKEELRICWPYFDNCSRFTEFSLDQAKFIFVFYLLTIILGLFLFFKPSKHSVTALIVLEVVKLLIQSIDYRFMGNYHFMPHLLTLVYLLSANPQVWLKIWLVSFYWAAASLKGNVEWLTGSGLSWKVPFQWPELLPYLALVVVIMEINIPFLLLSGKRIFLYFGLLVISVFHLASFYWVGFFYPLTMFCLLSIFILFKDFPPFTLKHLIKDKIMLALWAIFFVNQFQNITGSREFSLDGYKRLYSLNMFDATAECLGFFIIKKDNFWEQIPFVNDSFSVRVKCDNVIFMQQARNFCRTKDTGLIVDGFLYSRLTSDIQQTQIIAMENLCAK